MGRKADGLPYWVADIRQITIMASTSCLVHLLPGRGGVSPLKVSHSLTQRGNKARKYPLILETAHGRVRLDENQFYTSSGTNRAIKCHLKSGE